VYLQGCFTSRKSTAITKTVAVACLQWTGKPQHTFSTPGDSDSATLYWQGFDTPQYDRSYAASGQVIHYSKNCIPITYLTLTLTLAFALTLTLTLTLTLPFALTLTLTLKLTGGP